MDQSKDTENPHLERASFPPKSDDPFEPSVVPFGLTPAHVLAIGSLPFCIGAYVGYQRQVDKALKEQQKRQAARSKSTVPLSKAKAAFVRAKLTAEGRVLAARALGIGTLLSFGGFGMICAFTFYASGYRSWNEAVTSVRRWGRKRRSVIEESYGFDLGFRDHPDAKAIKDMTEDEELEYIQKKYLSNVTDEEGAGDGQSQ
jgi:hypothetical protein